MIKETKTRTGAIFCDTEKRVDYHRCKTLLP